jgi:hypothetical protein
MKNLNFKKELTNFDIANICNRIGVKLNGIFMKDELSSNLEDGNYIINLQNHNQSGSHWCCFVKSKNCIYYFDPFGAVMPQNQLDIFKANHENIYYSNIQIQDMKSILCGYFCILYLYFVSRMNGTIRNRISQFQKLFNWIDQKNNDKILKSYFTKLNF